jgi:hypothetical protein
MTAHSQGNSRHNPDMIWDSFIWWAGLAVAVLTVPSIAIVFATVMPFRSDVAESIIFVLLCWTCTYLGMHLMKFYGWTSLTESAQPRQQPQAAPDALSCKQTLMPVSQGFIPERRAKTPEVKAMLYSKSPQPSNEQYNS